MLSTFAFAHLKSHVITKSGGIHKVNEILVVNSWFLQQSHIQEDVFWKLILDDREEILNQRLNKSILDTL